MRLGLREWYKTLLMIWVGLGLPGMVLGFGFAGGRIEAPPAQESIDEFLIFVAIWLFFLSPVIAAPFGIKWDAKKRPPEP
jgi:hypothetical protein